MHSTVWGNQEDRNGEIIEGMMDEKECLNDGSGARVNLVGGTGSATDLTLASQSLAGVSSWMVLKGSTVGRDHSPTSVNIRTQNDI